MEKLNCRSTICALQKPLIPKELFRMTFVIDLDRYFIAAPVSDP